MLTNTPEAIVAALGAAAIGAVWSSCSPDFGVQGVLDRFGQIEPMVFFAVDGYQYGGKWFDCRAKVADILRRSAERDGRESCRSSSREGPRRSFPLTAETTSEVVSHWLGAKDAELTFERLPFNHPLYILYSSGTTGVPKCIIHGAGGTLVQHLKEHQLHCDIRRDDRVFYFTTCGWMMWNWLVTALASEATLVLYDGSPFHPTAIACSIWRIAPARRCSATSAKFIDAVRKAGLRPRDDASPGDRPDDHVDRLAAGAGELRLRVRRDRHRRPPRVDLRRHRHRQLLRRRQPERAGLARRAAGARRSAWTSTSSTTPDGRCATPPASSSASGRFRRCRSASGTIRTARSTAPPTSRSFPASGVTATGCAAPSTAAWSSTAGRTRRSTRAGSGSARPRSIARSSSCRRSLESLAVGQQWEGDERIVLFVRLAPGTTLDDALRKRIGAQIRSNTTPRHVPARIVQVADIPRTKSGKIVELAVRHVIHGRPVKNREALANPEALELFRDLPELAHVSGAASWSCRLSFASGWWQQARRERPRECCGLLVGRGRRVEFAVAMTNVDRTRHGFASDDAAHIELRRVAARVRAGARRSSASITRIRRGRRGCRRLTSAKRTIPTGSTSSSVWRRVALRFARS